jgi:hypothetical protein
LVADAPEFPMAAPDGTFALVGESKPGSASLTMSLDAQRKQVEQRVEQRVVRTRLPRWPASGAHAPTALQQVPRWPDPVHTRLPRWPEKSLIALGSLLVCRDYNAFAIAEAAEGRDAHPMNFGSKLMHRQNCYKGQLKWFLFQQWAFLHRRGHLQEPSVSLQTHEYSHSSGRPRRAFSEPSVSLQTPGDAQPSG